jgi:mannose-6-phosphate isomerase-like protein (cupin superfamily)
MFVGVFTARLKSCADTKPRFSAACEAVPAFDSLLQLSAALISIQYRGAHMNEATQTIDLMQRAKGLSGEYENVVLNKFNDHALRMSRMEKAYFWHFHPNSDEVFLGVEGVLILELENERIELGPGQVFTVTRGIRHRTLPAGSYSVNLTFERLDMETVSVDETSVDERK